MIESKDSLFSIPSKPRTLSLYSDERSSPLEPKVIDLVMSLGTLTTAAVSIRNQVHRF